MKKTSSKKAPKAPKKATSNLTEEDARILEESLKMVEELNDEIYKVQKAKVKLEHDVSDLGKKVERNSKDEPKQNAKRASKLKEEIMAELAPTMKKLDPKAMKSSLAKELASLIEIEINKVKSEISDQNNKSRRSMTNVLADMEERIMHSLKHSEKVAEEVNKIKGIDKNQIINEVKRSVENTVANATKKIEGNSSDVQSMKSQLSKFSQDNVSIKNEQSRLLNEVKAIGAKSQEVNVSAIETKLNKLDEENRHIRGLLEKYEDALYNRNLKDKEEIEKKVDAMLKETGNNLKQVKKEEQRQGQFLVDKVNEIVENVNSFEAHLEKLEEKSVKSLQKKIREYLTNDKRKFSKDLDLKYKADTLKNREEVERAIAALNERDQEINNELTNFKDHVQVEVKDYVAKVEKELNHIIMESKTLNLEKEGFVDQLDKKVGAEIAKIEERFNSIFNDSNSKLDQLMHEKKEEEKALSKTVADIDVKFQSLSSNLSEKNQSEMAQSKAELEEQVKKAVNKFLNQSKEDVSKQIFANKEFLTRMLTENKEERKKFVEELEDRLVSSTNQFHDDYDQHLEKFEVDLKTKEEEFLQKMMVIEQEKKEMLKEMDDFRKELANLMKEYMSSANEELEKVRTEEQSFEKEKNLFLLEINDLTNVRKGELSNHTEEMKSQVAGVLEEEKQTFDRHEETFRELFTEKIQSLHDYTAKRIDRLEKKFVEKNVKYVREKVEQEIKVLQVLEDSLSAKSEEILKRVEAMQNKEDNMAADLKTYETNINEKVETRMTDFEQKLNKRFLDIDSGFTNFKGTVVDEVEDLMKSVEKLMEEKVETVDKYIAKINFAGSEVVKRIASYDEITKAMDDELRMLRDEVNDMRVKIEVEGPHADSLTNLVSYMSDYEDGLISLINSLKSRGVSTSEIRRALQHKGHPMFYVNMVLENFNSIKH